MVAAGSASTVCLDRRGVLGRADHGQASGPSGAERLPHGRQDPGSHLVVDAGVRARGAVETDLVEIDERSADVPAQDVPEVEVEAGGGLPDAGRAAQPQDRSAPGSWRTLLPYGRTGSGRPSRGALPHLPNNLSHRQAAGVDAQVTDVAGVQGLGLGQRLGHHPAVALARDEPPGQLLRADAQPAQRQGDIGNRGDARTVHRIDDPRHDDGAGTRCPVAGHHRAQVLCRHPVPPRIGLRLGIAHAQLVDVHVADFDAGSYEFGVELPRDGGLSHAGRSTQPQHRCRLAAHLGSVTGATHTVDCFTRGCGTYRVCRGWRSLLRSGERCYTVVSTRPCECQPDEMEPPGWGP